MKVSFRVRYACIAMVELASHYGSGKPIRIRQIAERHEIPSRFLVQILLQLKGAGWVASTRGKAGGYQLSCPPEDVSLGQVMDLVDSSGSFAWGRSPSASPDSPAVKVLTRAWQDVATEVHETLHGITFAELLDRTRQEESPTYYI